MEEDSAGKSTRKFFGKKAFRGSLR